jgi:glycerol-3-phosphate dehydrogenase (NAD(P)+)
VGASVTTRRLAGLDGDYKDPQRSDARATVPAVNVAVIGSGSWGTAVAAMVATRAPTTLWARREEAAAEMRSTRENTSYLPGIELPEQLTITSDLSVALERAGLVVVAVPSHGFREVLQAGTEFMASDARVISLSKGVERGSQLRMTEVAADVLSIDSSHIGVLTGPNLAREVALGQPAAAVVAIPDGTIAKELQALFMQPSFRVYTNSDVVGCESAGALKNVMAIAAGMAHGLGYGDNSKAALVTRALAELTRLGVALGGVPLTFAGLAGMGDLVATCFSDQSRNRRVGVELGMGKPLDVIVAEMKMVAEGVKSTEAILALAAAQQIEMPIATMVGAVLYEGALPADMVEGLMTREAKAELHGIE